MVSGILFRFNLRPAMMMIFGLRAIRRLDVFLVKELSRAKDFPVENLPLNGDNRVPAATGLQGQHARWAGGGGGQVLRQFKDLFGLRT